MQRWRRGSDVEPLGAKMDLMVLRARRARLGGCDAVIRQDAPLLA